MLARLGVILIVAGALSTRAIDLEPDAFDLVTVGWTLPTGDVLSLVAAPNHGAARPSSSQMTVDGERHRSSDQRHAADEVEIAS
jgi:hypothetical protein